MHEQFASWAGIPAEHVHLIAHCEAVPYERDGVLAGIGMLDGTEIHFAAAPGARHSLLQRDRIRAYLAPLLERKGFLTTRVHDGSDHRFVERLGFQPTGCRGPIRAYMLCDLPFARN